MKPLLISLMVFFIFSCSIKNEKNLNSCPEEISQKGFCDLYNDAKWQAYASNSLGKFEYNKSQNNRTKIIIDDILSLDLVLFSWRENNDTVSFSFTFDTSQVDLYSFYQKIQFTSFSYSKISKKLICRKMDGIKENNPNKTKGYIFYTGDKTYQLLDSSYRHNPNYSDNMRSFGLYPLNEQDSILISKIKSGRKDINCWLIDYAKQKGFIK